MSELSDAFRELLEAHRRIGSPAADYLLPGRPEPEVRRTLVAAGVEPSDEVVEYFTLQNGIDNRRWFGSRPPGTYSDLYLYPPYDCAQLEDVHDAYRRARESSIDFFGPEFRRKADVPELGYWARSWVPVMVCSLTLAADCRGGSTSIVWCQATHPGDGPTAPLYPTIAHLLRDITLRVDRGLIWWTEKGFEWDASARLELDEQLAAAAASFDPFDVY